MSNRLRSLINLFRIRRLIILGVALASFLVVATPATLVIDSKLRASPNFQAKNLVNLKKGEAVNIKKRQRGWYQVETQSRQTGWLTLLQVRYKKEKKAQGQSEFSKLISLRRGANAVTATTGVRGIGENDIKNSRPNFVALDQALQYQSTPSDAKAYANQVALKSHKIKYQEKRND